MKWYCILMKAKRDNTRNWTGFRFMFVVLERITVVHILQGVWLKFLAEIEECCCGKKWKLIVLRNYRVLHALLQILAGLLNRIKRNILPVVILFNFSIYYVYPCVCIIYTCNICIHWKDQILVLKERKYI